MAVKSLASRADATHKGRASLESLDASLVAWRRTFANVGESQLATLSHHLTRDLRTLPGTVLRYSLVNVTGIPCVVPDLPTAQSHAAV
jgi:hypothetical protein